MLATRFLIISPVSFIVSESIPTNYLPGHSAFDVGRSMFDVHSFRLRLWTFLTPEASSTSATLGCISDAERQALSGALIAQRAERLATSDRDVLPGYEIRFV